MESPGIILETEWVFSGLRMELLECNRILLTSFDVNCGGASVESKLHYLED